MSVYKKAAQKKLRFQFRGLVSVEDLFDLGTVDLDAIYRGLKQKQGDASEGLLQKRTKEDVVLALKLEIVEDVFKTKQAEADARKLAADRKARKERILEIMETKQDEALMEKPLEDLEKMLDEL